MKPKIGDTYYNLNPSPMYDTYYTINKIDRDTVYVTWSNGAVGYFNTDYVGNSGEIKLTTNLERLLTGVE